MSIITIFKNDPLYKMITGKGATKKRKKAPKRGGLSTSEKRIVNAVASRVKSTKKKKRY